MILILAGTAPLAHGQIRDDLAFIVRNNSRPKAETDLSFRRALDSGSEARIAIIGLLRLYKIFISSQDSSVCNFTVSCSRFGMEAVNRFGIVHGLLMTSDRLQRCNGLGRVYYPQDSDSGLSIDHPLNYYCLGKSR